MLSTKRVKKLFKKELLKIVKILFYNVLRLWKRNIFKKYEFSEKHNECHTLNGSPRIYNNVILYL